MSKEQYPLIKRCFPELSVTPVLLDKETMKLSSAYFVTAENLEREIEKAVRVYGTNLNDNGIAAGDDPQWFLSIKREKNDTHTAFLVGIEPIHKDTAESLLKQLISVRETAHDTDAQELDLIDEIANRAKRLLEGK